MAYQLKMEQKPKYLHFMVTGHNSPETVESYMGEVMRACAAHGHPRVLIEEQLEGPRLGTMEVFQLVAKGSKRYRGVFEALAFVDLNADDGVMRFAEDVAVNRGIPVRVFRKFDGAETWLLGLPSSGPGGAPQKPSGP